MATSSGFTALMSILFHLILFSRPMSRAAQSTAYGYPKCPQAPTMTDETKPAQLANRIPVSGGAGCMVAGSGCRCSTPFFVSDLPSERSPRRCSSTSLFAHTMGCLASPDSSWPRLGWEGSNEPCPHAP